MSDLLMVLGVRHWIGLAVLLGIIVAAVLLKRRGNDRVVVHVPQPGWKMTSRLQGALIAPTRSIYSTHIQPGNVAFVEYKGLPYKVFSKRVVDDPRARANGEHEGAITDITILDHEAVDCTSPVPLVQVEPHVGDPINCYFHNRTVKCKVGFVNETIVYNAGAIPGDSSSPVANGKGELVTLNSYSRGYGPNLFRIRDILFDGLPDNSEPTAK